MARTYGFRGGLVPGVDVYAYMTHVPSERWGLAWLGHGSIRARFAKPVYDGRVVTVSASEAGELLDLQSSMRAAWSAPPRRRRADRSRSTARSRKQRLFPPNDPRPRPPPCAPAPCSGRSPRSSTPRLAPSYLADVRESLPLFGAVAHPGWLLRFANAVLARNVVLGPWIHVSSDVSLLGIAQDGERVTVRAVVIGEFERRGHRFVTLDVALDSEDRPVQRITHTAIHTPRRAD